MVDLADRVCDCARVPLLDQEQIETYLAHVPLWIVSQAKPQKLERNYKTVDFKSALLLAGQIGEIAESINHHPDLTVSYGQLVVQIFTHSKGGLTEADFILAAKIDRLSVP
ncbi:MAG: 4a-hydroxytetrahydrobiopterin dehydratase [Candidatus Obscuribacter sp.]|nr:4a-hydroxytetrahydrobiopterin dehydratase [Candidatus Obscuribacter sp.]